VGAAPPPDHPRSGRDVLAAALRESAEEAAASLRSAAEDARAAPLFGEDLAAVGLDHDRREAMDAAFDEGAADMARRLERRHAHPSEPETLAGLIVGAVKVGLQACLESAAIALAGTRHALEVAYDGDLMGIAYGTPAQARAFRALRDHGDAAHFLRVEGQTGEDALLLDLLKVLPVAELAERAADADADRDDPQVRALSEQPRGSENDNSLRSFDLFSVRELHEWRNRWVEAAYRTAEFLAGRTRDAELRAIARGEQLDESAEAAEAARLTPAELLLMFAVGDTPRGYAGGDARAYQDVQTLRRRLQRRLKKASGSMSE
jgi:hypothetical protein